MNLEITVKIECPDLTLAATALAKALMGFRGPALPAQERPKAEEPKAVEPAPAPAPAPAPTITRAQIAKAGADLITAHREKLPELNGLLQQFGVRSATDLTDSQIDEFAAAMRQMGAAL